MPVSFDVILSPPADGQTPVGALLRRLTREADIKNYKEFREIGNVPRLYKKTLNKVLTVIDPELYTRAVSMMLATEFYMLSGGKIMETSEFLGKYHKPGVPNLLSRAGGLGLVSGWYAVRKSWLEPSGLPRLLSSTSVDKIAMALQPEDVGGFVQDYHAACVGHFLSLARCQSKWEKLKEYADIQIASKKRETNA